MNNTLVPTLFEQQAQRYPHREAIRDQEVRISYQALHARVEELANLLAAIGVKRSTLVHSFLPVSANMVTSMLAIFKSAGIYLPMDKSFSEQRFTQIFQTAFDGILITSPEWKPYLLELVDQQAIELKYLVVLPSTFQEEIQVFHTNSLIQLAISQLEQKPIVAPQADDGNYIYYTSGSTGGGKPILGSHKSLAHYIRWAIRHFSLDEQALRMTHLSNATFDASLKDTLMPLCSGGTLCIPGPAIRSNILSLLQWINDYDIHSFHTVPSFFRLLLKTMRQERFVFKALKYIMMYGEVMYGKDVLQWHQFGNPETRLVNLYGTTESTILDTCHIIDRPIAQPNQIIDVGKPIAQTFIIIAKEGRLCKIGEEGEVFVKTPFLTKGYYQLPKLTAEAFVQNPLDQRSKDIVYRTGDRGKYLPDRSIMILGRIDKQVKINGIRIELNEIQLALLAIEEVRESIVVVKSFSIDKKELVAHFVSDTLNAQQLRKLLEAKLNKNVIPTYLIPLDALPLNKNGKVDKQQLPDPAEATTQKLVALAQTPTEKALIEIIETILNRKEVSREDAFFEIGGQSLKAMQLIAHVFKQLKVNLRIADIFDAPTIAALAERIDQAAQQQQQQIPNAPLADYYPLSNAQKRLWLIEQLDGTQDTYHIYGAYRLHGPLNLTAFEQSIQYLIDRHEVFRTCFVNIDGWPKQKIITPAIASEYLTLIDKSDTILSTEELTDFVELINRVPFDLEQGALLHLQLIKLGKEDHLLTYCTHHIISDGWSIKNIVREISQAYNAYTREQSPALAPLNIQYKDYAHWLNQQMDSSDFERHQQYWLSQFESDIPILELPTDFPRINRIYTAGQEITLTLNQEKCEALKRYCQHHEVSLFMLLMAAVNIVFYRYTRNQDIIIGVPTAGRVVQELEDQIGFYINTLALRNRVKGEAYFTDFLQQVKQTTLEGLEHQQFPFDELVELLQIERRLERSPLFDVIVQFLDYQKDLKHAEKTFEGLHSAPFKTSIHSTKFDFSFNFFENSEGQLGLLLEYKSELYLPQKAERLAKHVFHLLEQILENDRFTLQTVDFIDAEERQALRQLSEAIKMPFPEEKTFAQLFEEQVERVPNTSALIFEGATYSYRQLNQKANRLAHYLLEQGVKKETLVGLAVNPSVELIIGLMGILKAGGAYVPIDPTYPQDRIDYILENSGCKLLLDDQAFEQFRTIENQYSDANLLIERHSSDLAYVMYTSGSTGRPKGVMVEQRGLINRLHWMWKELGLQTEEVVLQKTVFTFDVSVWELFLPLCWGNQMVLCNREDRYSPKRLLELIEKHQVNTLHFVPSMFRSFLATLSQTQNAKTALGSVKRVLASGEALTPEIVNEWYRLVDIPLYNLYGPTEASIEVSCYLTRPGDTLIPIGQPIWNTSLYVLDSEQQLVPVGVEGEIWIGGVGVARGYHRLPELTEQKFVAHPFIPGERMYHTGDIGKWLPDHQLAYLGRMDDQVKVRGYRIELGEIEHALLLDEELEAVAVTASGANEQELSAYIVSSKSQNIARIKEQLRSLLPEYMIPDHFIQLPALPLNQSGKVDKQSLLSSKGQELPSGVLYTAPQGIIEKQLAAIWSKILDRQNIGIDDHFFEIGGHSLKASRLVALLNEELQIGFSLTDIFRYPTIRQLAAIARQKPAQQLEVLEQLPPAASYAVSHAQRRIWLQSQDGSLSVAYNLSAAFRIQGALNINQLKAAFVKLIERHESLRTSFALIDEDVRQIIHSAESLDFDIQIEDCSAIGGQEEALKKQMADRVAEPFDFNRAPLIRVHLFDLAVQDTVLLITLHHIISDGWSIDILYRELMQFYEAPAAEALPPLSIQFKEGAAWQNKMIALHQEAAGQYWLSQLNEGIPAFEFPSNPIEEVPLHTGGNLRFSFSAATVEKMHAFNSQYGISLFMFMQAIVHLSLFRFNRATEMMLGTAVAGRDHAELEDQIGCYINVLPLKLKVDTQQSFTHYLKTIKTTTLEVFSYPFYPIDLMIEQLKEDHQISSSHLFDVGLTVHNQIHILGDLQLSDSKLSIQPIDLEQQAAKTALWFNLYPIKDQFSMLIEYDRRKFSKNTIRAIERTIKLMIDEVLSNPQYLIHEIMNATIEKEAAAYSNRKTLAKKKRAARLLDIRRSNQS